MFFITILIVGQILSATYAELPLENIKTRVTPPQKVDSGQQHAIEGDSHDDRNIPKDVAPVAEPSITDVKIDNKTIVEQNSKAVTNPPLTKQVKDTVETSNSHVLPVSPNVKDNLMDSGALLRGFYVFLGLSLVTIFYFLLKTYRLRNGSQPPAQVRKYGVLTRRGDVEMLPLPLDDEDEDDTVFDLGSHPENGRSAYSHS